MRCLFQNRFRCSSHVRRRSLAGSPVTSLERLEPRLALAGDVSRPLLEPATNLYMDPSMVGPQPVVMGKSQVVGHDVKSFVITKVPAGSVVEKLDTVTNTWVDVSTKPTSSNPRELLRLLQARLIQQGDSLRWTPKAGAESSVQQAFQMIGWDDGSELPPGPDPGPDEVPSAVQNLVVAQTGVDELTATWQPSASGIPDTYSVTLKSSDGRLSMQTAVTRATSVTFGSLVAGVTYSVAVSANNAYGAGAFVETQTIELIAAEDHAPKTIGLWHETVPTGSWDVNTIQSYLSGTGATAGLGFESYATDYVNYVSNLKRLAAADGRNIDLGTVYFAIGDPGNEDWTTNNVYKYAIPSAEGIAIPLINEHVIIKLAEAGVKEFGFVVGDLPTTAWSWTPENYTPTATQPGVNPNIEKLFVLISMLNTKLQEHYAAEAVLSGDAVNELYISHLGFDNEGFGKIYISPTGDCHDPMSPGTVVNQLWDEYLKDKWGIDSYQWGITGASPPVNGNEKCNGTVVERPTSARDFAYVELYNVPGDADSVLAFDHPGFWVCSSPWTGDGTQSECNVGNQYANYNIYYGLDTPSRRLEANSKLPWDITSPDYKQNIYSHPEPSLSDIMAKPDVITPEIYYDNVFNRSSDGYPDGYVTGLSTSDLYKDIPQSVMWMMSIENLSSSYGAIKEGAVLPTSAPYHLDQSEIDVSLPDSSISLKYKNKAPFNIDTSNGGDGPYLLNQPLTTSGTFEALGGWEMDQFIDMAVHMSNQPNSLIQNFMIYEFAFVKNRQLAPNYSPTIAVHY
ncbi:MAG: fibronectin type III domain-containing protein [Pirellulales bacterium]|nr:fibronectin type III domain-containing protein [Pirellulales bacterium]